MRLFDGEDPQPRAVRFEDVDADIWWAPHVQRLYELGITVGCTQQPARYCPHQPVPRKQMASLLVRAFDLPRAIPAGFTDTNGSVHEANIDALHKAGLTIGCAQDPLRFCPDQLTTRAHMAAFIHRAVTGAGGESPRLH